MVCVSHVAEARSRGVGAMAKNDGAGVCAIGLATAVLVPRCRFLGGGGGAVVVLVVDAVRVVGRSSWATAHSCMPRT